MEELIEEQKHNFLYKTEIPEVYKQRTPLRVDYSYITNLKTLRKRARKQIDLCEKDENFQFPLTIKDTVFFSLFDKLHIKEYLALFLIASLFLFAGEMTQNTFTTIL